MRRRIVGALAAAAFAAAACGGVSRPAAPTASPAAVPAVAAATATPFRTAEPPPTIAPTPTPLESLVEAFDPGAFGSGSATITNPWLPLAPGTQWVHEGEATIEGERLERRVELTVTDLVKTIAGVRTVVALEQDYNKDELVESELVFWAQDTSGTVWRLGEYPEAWEDGAIVETPTWIHGFEDASAGIAMKADAAVFGPSYSQGWGPAVDWTDRGRVFETGSTTCVPVACYEDVLVIDEFNLDEPDTHQLKYYARGVGVVRVGWAGAREEEQEVLELVAFRQLGPTELAQVREEALKQDARGYENSPDVYARTPPAE
jgi:hypothetical protein